MSGRATFTRTPYRLGGITSEKIVNWLPALTGWGLTAGAGISLFMSATPIFKRDVLSKIPVFGDIWVDKTPESDKPF